MALPITLAVVALLLLALAVYVATRPPVLRVERSAVVGAPAAVVFPIINELHQWHRWSPYDKRDPDMKRTFDGPPAGPGSVYAWNGNKHVGEGRMTILESTPNERVHMKLEFVRPFACTNRVTFTLAPSAGGTRVSWLMEGKNTLTGKVLSLFINMDKMVGTDFEQGLSNLDAAARAVAQQPGRDGHAGARREATIPA